MEKENEREIVYESLRSYGEQIDVELVEKERLLDSLNKQLKYFKYDGTMKSFKQEGLKGILVINKPKSVCEIGNFPYYGHISSICWSRDCENIIVEFDNMVIPEE